MNSITTFGLATGFCFWPFNWSIKWYQLVSTGINWYQLVSTGINCYQLLSSKRRV